MNDEIKTLEAAARFTAQKGIAKFTRFLDPAQAIYAERFAKDNGVLFSTWGGYEDAERVVGCFHTWDDEPEAAAYPLVCLHSKAADRFCSVTHRDLLGAFMALGLTRSCVGDMIINNTGIYLFATEQTADFIAVSMTSAGKMPLSFSVLNEVPVMPPPKGTAFSGVVSSLRLDAVLACAYRLSRSEAAEAIRSGLVKVDHIPCERVDTVLKQDTLLSLKGSGRIRLTGINGMTKKQRIGVSFFRYE